jgi:hypothetical protein
MMQEGQPSKTEMKQQAAATAIVGVICIGLIRIAPVALETLGFGSA